MDVREILDTNNLEYKFSVKDYIIKCLAPDHDDKSPSCHVDKLSGIFQCWSCGYSGNLYKHFNLLAPNLINVRVEALKEKITKLMWSQPLELPLGYAAVDMPFRGISAETLKHFEAFTSDDTYLGMEGRIIFPIRDIHGDIKLFLGRLMYSDLEPKYMIFPAHSEIPMYPKIPEIIQGSIVLVEGIFDLLNLWDKGLKNAVLCGGTNIGHVKKRVKQQENINKLLQYKYQGVSTIYTMFDGDNAGRTAAEGLKNYAGETFNIINIPLADDKDPGSLTLSEVRNIKEEIYGKKDISS